MAVDGFVDWKGNPIDKKKHGGVRAACFIYFLAVMSSVSYVPNVLTLVTYLRGTMHAGVASSSTTVTDFIGVTCAFSLLGAFVSDSYVSRFKTVLIFGPFEFLGFGLLALQAHFPSLRPPPCAATGQPNNCDHIHGLSATVLYVSLYTIAVGEGCMRAAVPSLGADQFDDDDHVESQQRSSFFNWFTFGISLGVFTGVLLIVWIENNVGWAIGFATSASGIMLGLLVLVSGLPFYRHQIPTGSPLTRLLQVFVAAFKKRNFTFPEKVEELKQGDLETDVIDMEVLPHTKGFKFLEKASIYHGDNTSPWSYCSTTQVEETKTILRLLPILISSIIAYIPIPLLLTFSIQQGASMNTRFISLHISPVYLMLIPVTFQLLILLLYDRLFMPLARRFTGYSSGVTSLQRIGAGFLFMPVATIIAAIVERKRKDNAEEYGDRLPVMWLGLQFFMLGINDVTNFVGLLEFFNGEVSGGMKSIGTAIFWCVLGLASLLGSFLVKVVNKVSGNGGAGWLEGKNLNESKLDRFYWFLSVVGVVAFFNYLYWARRYVYRRSP